MHPPPQAQRDDKMAALTTLTDPDRQEAVRAAAPGGDDDPLSGYTVDSSTDPRSVCNDVL